MPQMREITNELKDSAYKVWLAGLGALAVTEEEGGKFFNNLVDKGEKFEAQRKGDLETVKDKAGEAIEAVGSRWSKLESVVDERVGKALDKLGLPSRSEIQDLSQRVEELTAKLSELETKPARNPAPRKASKKTTAKKTSAKRA